MVSVRQAKLQTPQSGWSRWVKEKAVVVADVDRGVTAYMDEVASESAMAHQR